MGTYVQYGSGFTTADGWISFDSSPTLRIERLPLVGGSLARLAGNAEPFPASTRFGDVVTGLPLADGSVDGLYASHVLEHLSFEDMRKALAESFRVLRPSGVFRLIVPDLHERARRYLAAEDRAGAAHEFMRSTFLGHETRPRSLPGRLRAMLGNSAHLWMYDYPALASELERAGFVAIRPAAFGDADDPMFALVEDRDRFIEGDIPEVAIEARKQA